MQQAAPAICFADSDDEDYVSFDEEELNTGIANLYDEDSASDYDDDDCEEEPDIDELVFDAAPVPQAQAQAPAQEKKSISNLFGMISSNKNEQRSAFSVPQPQSSAVSSRKKKTKSSQVSKRMHRLKANQEVLQNDRQKQRKKKVVHRQKVNTNIISIDLGSLKDAATTTGDSYNCTSCSAILSKHDLLLKTYNEMKLDDDDDSIWICKFCNHINIINIDDEEVPKTETVDYILAPPPSSTEEAKENDAAAGESQVLFCMDMSGSMCVSQKIDTKHSRFKLKGNHLQKDHDDLSAFIDANAGNLNKQKSDAQYVSRLQCVQTAVNEQIESMSKTHPNYKIGLVTFNSEVTVIGDGMSEYEIIAGDKLKNMEKLKEIGAQCKVKTGVGVSHEALCKALWSLEERGQTALGPALVVSIAIAAAKPGSQVILCTDGLANIGVGSLEEVEQQDQIEADDDEDDPVLKWYETLGDYAMMKGVVVNIISITDDGCKLENLGKIVEVTNGNLRRINPLNLADKFSGIIESESVATNCQAKMLLHPGLLFHNTVEAAEVRLDEIKEEKDEDEDGTGKDKENEKTDANVDKINEGRSIYKISSEIQEPGNVFEGSRVFFEYVINKEKRSDFKDLKELPFQVQVRYTKKDGTKMLRVITQTNEITLDREKVRNNLDFKLLAKYGTHVTTELCRKGDYESSRAWTSANTTFLNKNARNSRQFKQLANYAQENVALDHQMQRQMVVESTMEMDVDEDDDEQTEVAKSKSIFSRKKKKMAKRKKGRNDQFSSHMYNLKRKSHK